MEIYSNSISRYSTLYFLHIHASWLNEIPYITIVHGSNFSLKATFSLLRSYWLCGLFVREESGGFGKWFLVLGCCFHIYPRYVAISWDFGFIPFREYANSCIRSELRSCWWSRNINCSNPTNLNQQHLLYATDESEKENSSQLVGVFFICINQDLSVYVFIFLLYLPELGHSTATLYDLGLCSRDRIGVIYKRTPTTVHLRLSISQDNFIHHTITFSLNRENMVTCWWIFFVFISL